MTTLAAVHMLAAASGLVLIALALTTGAGSPLRRPLALLAANQFAWNAASFGVELTRLDTFAWLGAVAAPFFPPLALHVVLSFVGRRRRFARALAATYLVFTLQALLALVELLVPGVQFSQGLGLFALLLLASSAPVAVVGWWLVVQHLRRVTSEPERLRTRLLLTAIVLVVLMLTTEPLADLGYPVPHLASLGSFAFNAVLSHLAVGLGLFQAERSSRGALGRAVVVGLFFSVVALLTVNTFSAQTTLLLTATTALCLALAVAGWLFLQSTQRSRVGLERFAALGRFSAQMAHDLKNPLAAAKGAAEYLAEEMRRAGDATHTEFAGLVVAQLDRLQAVIDRYQRLSKLEPQLTRVDANQLVTRVVSLQRFASDAPVTIERQLAEPAPVLQADADLLASALENLVKNALEAMPRGGTLTVRTAVSHGEDEAQVTFSVSDTGSGFDARALEQAFELFFTTKATGSGLGLPFVRQVARAHGGDAALQSVEGRGTTVSLVLPVRPPTGPSAPA